MQIPFSILSELKKYRKIFVQYPEGLQTKVFEIKKLLEGEGIEAIFDIEPTYGYCDLRDDEAVRLGCEAILHIGHNSFGFNLHSKIPVIVWEYKINIKEDRIQKIILDNWDIIDKFDRIGLVSSLQYLDILNSIREILEKGGKRVIIPKNPQILGCNLSNAKLIEKDIDAFLVPTSGKFYIIGLLLETDRTVLSLNFDKEKVEELSEEREKYKRIIYYNYQKFKEARRVGLLVSWKKGQIFFDPFKVKKTLEEKGKETIILSMDRIDQSKLYGIDVEVYVNLSCPRIFDDYENFERPIINWRDILKIEGQFLRDSSWIREHRHHHNPF